MRSTPPRLCAPLFLVLLAAGTFLVGDSPCRAQVAAPTEETVTAARARGVKYLKSQQKKDGSWDFSGHDVGITALCTIALIENGVEPTDPVVQNGYEFVKKKAKEQKNTYDLALIIVMLQRMGDRRDRPLIRTMAARLIAGQLDSGGWHYTCPGAELDVEKVMKDAGPKPKAGFGDNSCTQFAVLGLWVASRTGIDIEKTLKRVTDRFESNQTDDGGWAYAKDPKLEKQVSSPPMTGAGLFCLAVARAWELKEAQKDSSKKEGDRARKDETAASTNGSGRKTLLDDATFARGLKRTGEFAGGIGPGAGRYFLWSVERVGVLLGLDKIGDSNWFPVGANALLKDQKEDGSWPTAWPDTDADGLSDTCFALLFLRRANLGSDISRLLEEEHDEKFEILNRQPAARFLKLSDAVEASQPGETIRINGNGPWRLGHLEIPHELTILAGHGFVPTFKFEIARNRKSARYNPATDPEGRDMVTLKGGRLTLEGLRLQMDAPKDPQLVPWSIITVAGGELRLLNCSLSEAGTLGTAIAWRAPGQLVIRNSQLMGGKTAVDITGSGEQELVFDNSLAFSETGLTVQGSESGQKFALRTRHSVFQVKEVLACPEFVGEVSVDTATTAYRADWLSQNFLKTGKDPRAGRSWQGSVNLYDVKQWVGLAGQPATIKDPRDWIKYWKSGETDAVKRTAPFTGTRRLGSYSHEANIQDWQLEFPATAEAALTRNRVGVISYVAGPGPGYDQYRETLGYTLWKGNRLELSARGPDRELFQAGTVPTANIRLAGTR
ncbi:MAG TPA: hypothetical protein DDY91_10255 [Planctomycetaceae bacterium]|jgi:hypothetical protein|nr:hypothetical protein [Planctomycetaceae bacterium]